MKSFLEENDLIGPIKMDLRDYFAVKAMKIFIHEDICWNNGELEFHTNSCYAIADAMIKAREKK